MHAMKIIFMQKVLCT